MPFFPRAAGLSGLGSTDNAVLRANGTGGTSAQGSLVTIDDSGNVTATTLSANSWDNATTFSDILVQGGTKFRVTGSYIQVYVSELRPDTNALALRNGTADQTLSLGAASGTGGGVLNLNIISAAPAPISGQVNVCYLTAGINFDRPLIGVGSGLTSVPGTWTVGSNYAVNTGTGDRLANVNDYNAVDFSALDVGNIGLNALSTQVANLTKKFLPFYADAVNHISPNQ